MIIDFYNKNVADAKFKICWGLEQCTPVFSLEIGAMGSYDLSFSHTIQQGTQCHIYAWNSMTSNFNKGITFIYEEGKRVTEICSYAFNNFAHQADFEMVESPF